MTHKSYVSPTASATALVEKVSLQGGCRVAGYGFGDGMMVSVGVGNDGFRSALPILQGLQRRILAETGGSAINVIVR